MARLRINEVLKEHGLKQKDLAEKMGIKPISLNQMLGRGTLFQFHKGTIKTSVILS